MKRLIGPSAEDEILFFFVEREERDRLNAFTLPKAFFQYSFTQPFLKGESLVVVLRGIVMSIRPVPPAE